MQKKCYFDFHFVVGVSKTSYSSGIAAPFAPAGIRPVVLKPVKPGHYSELRPRILRVLLTL